MEYGDALNGEKVIFVISKIGELLIQHLKKFLVLSRYELIDAILGLSQMKF